MSLAPMTKRNKSFNQRLSYRYYSRQVVSQPANIDMHTSRLMIALELAEKEPLQGALADMFYGCWYDVPFFGNRILNQVKEKLSLQTLRGLEACILKADYIGAVSILATRWSVLVSPSMAAPSYLLRSSSDDAKSLAERIAMDLLDALDDAEGDYSNSLVKAVESEFFAHCLACQDKLAFSLVWWELNKHFWEFDEDWTSCQYSLNQDAERDPHLSESPDAVAVSKAIPL